MAKIPPYLQPGDTIGIVCPAGFMAAERTTTCIQVLQQWGFRVKVGRTVGHQYHYFSGTDEERLADLQQMLDDDGVQAVLCGRGGYGMGRIIDKIDFKKFRRHPKWVIGFSDITVFHAHVWRRYGIAGLHAPMAGAFNDGGYETEFVQSLRLALLGKKANYHTASHPFNQHGEATGVLVGGNLSLVAHLIGTPSNLKTKGTILFLEDVGEYIYNVDRMMHQLQRSGMLDNLAGLVLGGFTDEKDTTTPYGCTTLEVLKQMMEPCSFPVCFHFPVSHGPENYALKVGVAYRLAVSARGVQLSEV